MGTVTISTGGVLVALLLLAPVGLAWWRKPGGGGKGAHDGGGGRSYRTLVTPVLCLFLGIVLATAVGGLLGKGARAASKGTNQLGDDVLRYGVGATADHVSHPAPAALTGGSAVLILVSLLAFGLAVRKASKQRRRDLAFPLIAGLACGPAAFSLQLATAVILPGLAWLASPITSNL